MRDLLKLALRNATGNRRRMLVLGIFLLSTTFMVIMVWNLGDGICAAMRDSFIRGLTGHIQIRNAASTEGDIVAMGAGWDKLVPLSPETTAAVMTRAALPGLLEASVRIRTGGMLVSDRSQMVTLVTGVDPGSQRFRDSIDLLAGSVPARDGNGVLLTEKQARKLNAGVGDRIGILAQTVDGYTSDTALIVSGIVSIKGLSGFGFDVAFVSLGTARAVTSLPDGACTDLLLHLESPELTDRSIAGLRASLAAAGLEGAVKITRWEEMGTFIQGFFIFIRIILVGLMAFLLTIAVVLIVNLLLMTALDRFRDIGTLRALGFSRRQVQYLFLAEMAIVCLFFASLGALLAVALIFVLGLTGLPAFMPQLELAFGGKSLHFGINWLSIPLTMVLTVTASLAAAFVPARFASRMNPIKALQA